jgi:hypothetical protein
MQVNQNKLVSNEIVNSLTPFEDLHVVLIEHLNPIRLNPFDPLLIHNDKVFALKDDIFVLILQRLNQRGCRLLDEENVRVGGLQGFEDFFYF